MVRKLLTMEAIPEGRQPNVPELTGPDARGGLLMPWDDQATDPARKSFWGGAAQDAYSGVTLPRDVYEGRVDLNTDEGTKRVLDMAGLGMSGGTLGGTGAVGGTAIGSGPAMADRMMQLNRKYNPTGEVAPALADNRIAQRMPSSVQAAENGLEQDLRINVNTMRQTPETMDKAGELLNDVLPRSMAGAPTEEKFGAAQALMVNNLKHLYNTAPDELIQRAPLWYPGSNKIVTDLGQELGIPTTSAAGMAASLSPQKDWFQNVSLAQRIGRTLAEDPQVDQRMLERLGSGSEGMAAHTPQLAKHLGRRISELDPDDAGRAVWAHDIAYRDPSFRAWNPEGEDLGFVLKNSGENDSVTHQGLDATSKAVQSYRSGGDPRDISPLMGNAHKVRNFYNDIIAPYAKYDDWTNDTHNIAGSLYRPLSAGDRMTKEGLGNMGPKSSHTGAKGLYGLYADAGRQAAREVGMDDPSGMQSLVWEQIRARMPKAFKGQASNKKAVDAIWDRYRNGDIGEDEARSMIDSFVESKTPYKVPGWMR